MIYRSREPDETRRLGRALGSVLTPGIVVCLMGDLGAGKTTFTQGLAEGIGVTEWVNSPTFTLIREYTGRVPLYHMDLYRIQSIDALETLGLDDYLFGDGAAVVEWPDAFLTEMPSDRIEIRLDYRDPGDEDPGDGARSSGSHRRIVAAATGPRSSKMLERWEGACGF